MLAEERYRRILGVLDERKTVMVTELCTMLGTSESTVRRDLGVLSRTGKLIKVHGGATANENTFRTFELVADVRKAMHLDEKRRIAQFAATLIAPGDNVYLDGGSTVETMVDYLQGSDARYVTNAIGIAQRMSAMGHSIILLGGQFRQMSETLSGPETQHQLRKFNFTKGFFGAAGVSRHAGCTSLSIGEALVKKQAIGQTSKAYVLADATKFGVVCAITFADFDSVSIITSSFVSDRYMDCANITFVSEPQAAQ